MQGINFKKFLLAAFIIRLVLLPLAFHSDLTTNSIWGIYAKEFGLRGYYDWLNFGNYARPEYPPFSTILFMFIRYFYEWIFAIFWKINLAIPQFPSLFITWLDKYGYLSLLKLPSILADIGIGYLIYKITKRKLIANLYLFNPGIIYLSSLWGQTESFVGLLALLGLIFLIRKQYLKSMISIFISLMTKATMLPIVPVLIIMSIKNKIRSKDLIKILAVSVSGLFILGYFFTDHAYINWMINSYLTKFIIGPLNLGYINLNAFNFWGLILGLQRISDGTLFLGIPLRFWAWIISAIFFIIIILGFDKKRDVFFVSLMVFYASFMFLPRMHERYLYPIFIFFPLVINRLPKLKRVFWFVSVIFLINLYHWWSVPNIIPISYFFDLELVERGLSFANLFIFSYLLWIYRLS